MIDRLREMFSPQERRIVGVEAQQLLDNKHFRQAWEALQGYLVDKAKACDPTKPGHAENVVISMQLLEALKREFIRKVEDGEMAKIEIEQLEQRGGLRRLVR